MNICVLTHTFPRNDKDTAAAFMKDFADGLVIAGNKVFVLTPYDKEFYRKKDIFKIVTYKYIWPDFLHKLGYSRSMQSDIKLKVVNYFFAPLMIFFSSLALIKLIKEEKIDLVNVHWIIPNGITALLAKLVTRTPYVVTLPGTDVYLSIKNKIIGLIAKVVADRSSGLISNSRYLLNRFLSLNLKNVNTTGVIPYPIDTSFFKPGKFGVKALKLKLGLSEDDLVIMSIGRLVYKKGFSYLIAAMPKILQVFPNAKLIIGGSGDLTEELSKLIRKIKVTENVFLVGNISRNKILQYYNLADIFVAPSIVDLNGNVDGGPVSSYESMACAKPQVATDILGVSDMIKNGVNGFVVAEKSSDQLAEAVLKLFKNKSKREEMGRFNRILVVKSLNTKTIGLRYNEFFKKNIK